MGPDGLALTVPLPVPAYATVRVNCCDAALNVAVTDRLEFIVSLQLPVPEHAPDHPAKVDPEFGVAVSETTVPPGYAGPGGLALTVPLPVPAYATVRVNAALKVAVMISSAVTVNEHAVPVPEQTPEALPQPANMDCEFGVAVSVTAVPAG